MTDPQANARARQYYDWPVGYWPIHTRLREKVNGKIKVAKVGSLVDIEKIDSPLETAMIDYYTREPYAQVFVQERALLRLLVPKGLYRVTWTPTGREAMEPITQLIEAYDPLDSAYAVDFRDGHQIYIRPGRWDKLILTEQQHKKLPLKNHIVLDGGGHIGTFTRDALNQGAKFVVAYEADVINYQLYKANVAHLEPSKLAHFHTALGGENGTATLSLNLIGEGGGNALHSIHSRPSDRPKVTIPMREIVEVCEEYGVTCIKLDVEDAEGDYNYSALPPSVKVISIETKYFEDVPRRLREAGFTIDLKPFNTSNRAITGVVAREGYEDV